jgi:putative two-component system response regulator
MDAPMTIDQGARNLYYLTGYSSEEIADQFNNSLFGLLPPEDRHILSEMCRNCVQFGAKTEAEFRIMRNNGKQLTVLCKGLVCPEDDGTEYYYLTLTDVSYCIAQQKRREDIDLRNQLIVDQMDGVVFEWNLVNDMVTCSDKWQARFGYAPISDRFSTKLETATHFHPDDLIVLREQIQAVYNGASSVDKEVRIANQEGKYLWNRITASVLRRDDGVPVRIVGLITDINDRKTADLSLKQQAERDSLTGLYNKASGKKLIGDYLDQRKSAGLSAMMILDLDNFKTVNDNYGHLYGDALLTQVSTMLRGLFRAQDIIARIGGDEFLVLLKDIPSEDVLCARCDLLLNTSREMLHKLMPDLDVSCSVGCVLIPEHGTTYRALFKKADAALYVAKARGKNQYKIYDAQDQNSTLRVAPRTTRVDSDEDNSNTDETFARFVFHRLYESRNIDATISELLAFVGARYNVSRAYIFENNDDNTACSNTFEWCNVGIAPAMYSLQNLSYTTDLPGWPKLYDERGMFYCTDISTLPPEYREILEPQGIKSMLQCAIMDAGVFRGYVGFDECTSNRLWTQGQVSTLEFLAEVLAIFLIKQRTQNWSTHNLPPQKNAS